MRAPITDPVAPHSSARQPEEDLSDMSERPPVQFPPPAFPIPTHPNIHTTPDYVNLSSHGNLSHNHPPNFNMVQPQMILHYTPSGHHIPSSQSQLHYQAPSPYIHAPPFHAPINNNYNNPQLVSVLQVSPQLTGWTTGLFDCFDDPMNALVTVCIPCITFGQIAEIIDSGNTSCVTSGFLYGAILFLIGFPCILSCTYRAKLRSRFNLIESAGPDWVSHCLCESCALCQEYRELKNRGFDPSIGWHAANTQVVQYQVAMVPPINQTMRG